MAPTRRASCKVTGLTPPERPASRNTTKKASRERLTSPRAAKSSALDCIVTVRCTRAQSALRSKETMQVTVTGGVCVKDSRRVRARGSEAVGPGSISGICLKKGFHTQKGLKPKSSGKTPGETNKRKRCPRCVSGKSKKRLKGDVRKEAVAVQEAVPRSAGGSKNRESSSGIPAKPRAESNGGDGQASPDGRLEMKARIGLLRQRILEEQASVRGLRAQLARNKDTARASLSCRRIRIQKELAKLRERVQSEDKRRLQAEDHRVQRQLEAGRRRVDSERLSMRTRLAQEWRDRFQRRKSKVRRARQALKGRIRAHQADKGELMRRLRRDWNAQLSRVQAMRERLEMEMVRKGRQWDGEIWRTAPGEHKYSLRRAPREKAHLYYCGSAGRVAAKKVSPESEKQYEPPSGATVYKDTKQRTLMELYQILDSELRCSICSELLISVVVLNCSHTFCSFCIKQWKKRTDRCPICRASITSQNPLASLDLFLTKVCRRVGRDVEKKRAETLKDRQGQERELRDGGRTWGNFASHSLEDWDDDEDDDDFNGLLDSDEEEEDDDSDVDEFLEILQGHAFHHFFGSGLVDNYLEVMADSDSGDEDLFLSSDDSLDLDDLEELDDELLGEDDDD